MHFIKLTICLLFYFIITALHTNQNLLIIYLIKGSHIKVYTVYHQNNTSKVYHLTQNGSEIKTNQK